MQQTSMAVENLSETAAKILKERVREGDQTTP